MLFLVIVGLGPDNIGGPMQRMHGGESRSLPRVSNCESQDSIANYEG